MQKEQIFCAATVDRAIEKALETLHIDRDAVSVEVVEMGRRGFLGIGASDAKIRVLYEVPDAPKPPKTPKTEGQKTETPRAKQPQTPRVQNEAPRLVKAAPQSEKPKPAPKPEPPEKTPRLVRAAVSETPKSKPQRQPLPLPESEWTAEAKAAVTFIDGLLLQLGIEGHVFVTDASKTDHIHIEIQGPDMAPVIGRRGDTLDAIQYLTSLAMHRESSARVRLTLDTENYRVKRAESLERLACKMASKVVRYHKSMTLEPMNPYERRVIHAALQDYRGVTTHSTGTEPNRRVVISPEGGRQYGGKRSKRPAAKPEETE